MSEQEATYAFSMIAASASLITLGIAIRAFARSDERAGLVEAYNDLIAVMQEVKKAIGEDQDEVEE